MSFLGIVGAFGVSPGTQIDGVDQRLVIQSVAIEPTAVAAASDSGGIFWRQERVQRGDSLVSIFGRLQIDDPEAIRFLQNSMRNRTLESLSPGKTVTALTDSDGALVEFKYLGDANTFSAHRTGDQMVGSSDATPLETRVVMQSGTIQSSLFSATDEAGVPDSVASRFAELFSGDVDLHRDIRRGDRFSIVYEMLYSRGEQVRSGRILAAEFVNQGNRLDAVYFEDEHGVGSYYTPGGRNLRRAFLRSPLEFSRVTSGFSASRFHPVLQVWRAHKGTDYGAPVGTRVRSTADGVVTFVGWQNGYGKVVDIQHNGRFSTRYGHLSAFASDLRRGVKVAQGQVIGFVGMTGLATGPHLHYEFHVDGVQADPQRVAPFQGPGLSASAREAFERVAEERLAQIRLLATTDVAALE